MAALEAMRRANKEDPQQTRPLSITTDSKLLVRSMTEWVGAWRDRGWRKADGSAVMNQDLLQQLEAERGRRQVDWTHVEAHTGRSDWASKWNDVADKLAKEAAAKADHK
jgi:ribonuclease HI